MLEDDPNSGHVIHVITDGTVTMNDSNLFNRFSGHVISSNLVTL